jgi:hypothetical protein
MDLSKLSDSDLEALNAGDLSKVSDAGLESLQSASMATPNAAPAGEEPSMLGKIVGAGQVAGEMAAEHPVAAAAAGYGAYNLASKIPVVGPAIATGAEKLAEATIPKYKVGKALVQGASDWATKFGATQQAAAVAAQDANALAQMEHQARMLQKTGQAVPEGMQRAIDALRTRVGGVPTTPTAPVVPTGPAATGPVVPQAPAPLAQGAQMAEQAAARAPSLLDKTTSLIRQLAANKVVQGLGKGMTGLQLATYSQDLGPQTPQVGRMRGMEINPMTGRPWTKEQIAQYSANPQMFDSQLPQAQMPR